MVKKHGPWTIKETVRKYQNAFMEVNEDQVIQPDGQPGAYATITMTPGVAVLPVDDEGFVYLTRQFRYALGQEDLQVVAGGMEEGESEWAAAQREVHEELGIEAREWLDFGCLNLDTSIIRAPVRLFLAKGLKFSEPQREGTETIKTVKLSFAEALQKVMDRTITHGPTCVLVLKVREAGLI